ncbi:MULTISPECIES: nuclear transport factor 2 family protein [Pseudoalteromonas]|uniref:nuclear transport factor 2 family protein n=1 Tax=Pseudoalteromonas TaxID=53246 RepID=UPI001F0DEED4|nr:MULTISPECIES: nuclear transport factor 2 family protein [Pseudoalteromonas]
MTRSLRPTKEDLDEYVRSGVTLFVAQKKQARAQLADDVAIFEGGRVERSADEYAHHHMLSDMKYLAAMKSDTLEHQVTILGNTTISASRSQTTGTHKGVERDYQGMETMVLEKQNGEWKIKNIHWSHNGESNEK